ncbi:MAG: hypothetical protein IT306_14660 [Chloroflexi bacterium]|nr:hypothetical protein [Chloroflexota bacterium]
MVWVRLADDFVDHPKVSAAGPLAGWLYVCGLSYANRYATDGFIPVAQVRRLADVREPDALATKLVEARLWERVNGGYMIHDYAEFQPSAAEIRRDREAAAKRQAEFRRRRSEARNAARNGTSNAESNGVSNAQELPLHDQPVTRESQPPGPGPVPDPSRPGPGPVNSPQPPPQAEGARTPIAAQVDELKPWDAEVFAAAQARLRADLSASNWDQLVKPLQPVGRGADGGLIVRAPSGSGRLQHFLARALVDAGDEAGSRVAIVE